MTQETDQRVAQINAISTGIVELALEHNPEFADLFSAISNATVNLAMQFVVTRDGKVTRETMHEFIADFADFSRKLSDQKIENILSQAA